MRCQLVEDLIDWVEDQCSMVMVSHRAIETFRGKKYKHREVVYKTEGWGSDTLLVGMVKKELEGSFPSEVLFWRVKPEMERDVAHAPEDEELCTGTPYGRYVPPRTTIYLRFSTDNEVIDVP